MTTSKILAYSAFGFFFLTFLLALEGIGLDRLFRNHTRQFRWHHWMAIGAVVVIVCHILYEFWQMGAADWSLLFEVSDPALLMAWSAVSLLSIAFVSAWMARRLGHRNWLRLHWLVLPAIVLAAGHGALFDESRLVTWILAGLGLLAFLPVCKYLPSLFRKPCLANCSVSKSGNIVSVNVRPPLHKPYRAGQIVSVRFRGRGFSNAWHPFSVSSGNDQLQFLIRPVGRDTKRLVALNEVLIDLRGPFRDFAVPTESDMVWIGGGIGIAAFVGMAQRRPPSADKSDTAIRLLYFHRREDALLHPEVFDRFAADHKNFAWQEVIHPDEHTDPAILLANTVQCLPNAHFLVCGPPSFSRWIRSQLLLQGIPGSRIQADEWIG